MTLFHVTTGRGFNLYQVPAMSETEAELKVNRLAGYLGINDYADIVVESDEATESMDDFGVNWSDVRDEIEGVDELVA